MSGSVLPQDGGGPSRRRQPAAARLTAPTALLAKVT